MQFCIALICVFTILTQYPPHSLSSEIEREDILEVEASIPMVFLTVSSLASHHNVEERRLELNWYNVPLGTNEHVRVRLFSHEPLDNDTDYIVSVDPREHTSGLFLTSISFPKHSFSAHNLSDDCLGYWIAYVVSGHVGSHSCIRARPHWMHDARYKIANATLMDLMLPGTHNAGSIAPSGSEEDNVFTRYIITQDESIWNQLVYGIRYLDLRVTYERVPDEPHRFWITHSVFRTETPLRKVISEIKTFLNATNEIVIMDFHRFVNGFTGRRAASRHRSLIKLLEDELSEYMIPLAMSSWATLSELWEQGRRLYVGYATNSERSRSRYLFPAVKHLWGDKDNKEELFIYLNDTVCKQRQRRLTSAMAQLTPTTAGAIFNLYGGLRKMADDVNRHVTNWFADLWWPCANIVSTDFFLGNNIIETAIKVNHKKDFA